MGRACPCRLPQIISATLFFPLLSHFLKASPFRTCRTDRASSCTNFGKTVSPGWGRRRFSLRLDLWVKIMRRASSYIAPLSSQLPAVVHHQDLPALRYRLPGGARDGVHHAPPRSEPEPWFQCMRRGLFTHSIWNVKCYFKPCFMVWSWPWGGRVSSNSLLVDHEQQLTGQSRHCSPEEEPETVWCFLCFCSLFLGIIVAELFPACREGWGGRQRSKWGSRRKAIDEVQRLFISSSAPFCFLFNSMKKKKVLHGFFFLSVDWFKPSLSRSSDATSRDPSYLVSSSVQTKRAHVCGFVLPHCFCWWVKRKIAPWKWRIYGPHLYFSHLRVPAAL